MRTCVCARMYMCACVHVCEGQSARPPFSGLKCLPSRVQTLLARGAPLPSLPASFTSICPEPSCQVPGRQRGTRLCG